MALNGVRAIQAQYAGDGNAAGQLVKLPFTPHEAEISWSYPAAISGLPRIPSAVWAKKADGADFTSVTGPLWQDHVSFDGPHVMQLRYDSKDVLPQFIDIQAGGVFVRGNLNAAGQGYVVAARRFLGSDPLPARLAGAWAPS